jgi:hypothetical protein
VKFGKNIATYSGRCDVMVQLPACRIEVCR